MGMALGASIAIVMHGSLVAADEYTYYGGKVPAEEKNVDVENCEYRRLVEERTCNERINKSECIDDVYAACLAEFGPASKRPLATEKPTTE